MKLAIMQPYLLPYLGYLQLLAYADVFVVFDSVQYKDKGWINRNRILHPSPEKGWQYFTFPLAGKSNFQRIRDVRVKEDFDFISNLCGKLTHLKRAPFYKEVIAYLQSLRSQLDGKRYISDINMTILQDLTATLRLGCEVVSERDITYDSDHVSHPGQWALVISQALGADSYVNPLGGRDLFKVEEFADKNIKLEFLETRLEPYPQFRSHFEPALSVVDVLLWNGLSGAKKIIESDYAIRSVESK